MLHEVLRKFRGNGMTFSPGDIVETSSWRNTDSLLRSRFIGTPRRVAGEKLVPVNVQKTEETKSETPAVSTMNKRPEEAKEAKAVTSQAAVTRTAKQISAPAVGKVPPKGKIRS